MKIVPLTVDNIDSVRKLHLDLYGWPKDGCAFRKKYIDKTDTLKAIGYLAINSSGKAIAYYGVFLCWAEVGGSEILSAQSGDTMTHPDYQGRGLFTKLAKMTYETAKKNDVAFVFGFPNANSYPGFKKKLNWTFPYKMLKGTKIVPCIPFGVGADWMNCLDDLVLKKMGFNRFEKVVNDFSCRERCGVIRFIDREYSEGNYYEYCGDGSRMVIRIDRLKIYIGLVESSSEKKLNNLFKRLMRVAFFTGRPAVITYFSPACLEATFIRSKFTTANSLWFGYFDLQEGMSEAIENLQLRYIDYDTF